MLDLNSVAILRLQDIDSCSKATWFYNRKIVVIKKMLQNFLNEENDDWFHTWDSSLGASYKRVWRSSNNFSWTKCISCEAQFMLLRFFSFFLWRTLNLEKPNPTGALWAYQEWRVIQFGMSKEKMFQATLLCPWMAICIWGSKFWKHYRINGNKWKKPSEEVNWKEVHITWDPCEICDFRKIV